MENRIMSQYVPFSQAARLVGLSVHRLEQLIREPKSKFPVPFQPGGPGGRRMFRASELERWMETRRASY